MLVQRLHLVKGAPPPLVLDTGDVPGAWYARAIQTSDGALPVASSSGPCTRRRGVYCAACKRELGATGARVPSTNEVATCSMRRGVGTAVCVTAKMGQFHRGLCKHMPWPACFAPAGCLPLERRTRHSLALTCTHLQATSLPLQTTWASRLRLTRCLLYTSPSPRD